MQTVHHSTYSSALGYTAPFSCEGEYAGMETKETHFCGRPEAKKWDIHYKEGKKKNKKQCLAPKNEARNHRSTSYLTRGNWCFHIEALQPGSESCSLENTQKHTPSNRCSGTSTVCCAGQQQSAELHPPPLHPLYNITAQNSSSASADKWIWTGTYATVTSAGEDPR